MQTQTCHGLNLKNEAIEGSLFRYYGIGREKRRPMIPVVMSQVNPTPVGVKECPFHSTLSLDRDSESLSLMQTEQRITPGPSPISWRSLWDVSKIMRFGIHEAMLRFFETYGPICRFANPTNLNGKSGWLFLNDPKDIQYVCSTNAVNYTTRYLPDIYKFATHGKGILCSQGDYNRRHRAMCQPTFRGSYLNTFSNVIVERLFRRLRDLITISNRTERVVQWFAEKTTEVDLALVTQRLALDIIGQVAFSHDFKESDKIRKEIQNIESNYGADTDELVKAVNDFGDVLGEMFILPMPALNFLKRWNAGPLKRLERSLETQRNIMLDVIMQRRQDLRKGMKKKDLLGSLLEVYDEDGSQMTDEELWEDVHDIMGAGHETTASVLAACLYLVSVHPEIEERVVHEIDTVLGGRHPTFEDLESLVFTTQCVKETLRMYPPIPIFPREASDSDCLPSGYGINKGDVVFMAGYSLGRSKSLWEDPLRFNPDRFRSDLEKKFHKFQFCPFGAGNRMCIGPAFALMSLTLMLATCLQKLEFTALHPTAQYLDIAYDITMNFSKTDGLKMRVSPRATTN